jgi:hypothetical protein
VSPTEVTRRVSASGLIGVCYQQVSAGRYLTGQIVTVRLHPTVLQGPWPVNIDASASSPGRPRDGTRTCVPAVLRRIGSR